MADRIINTNVSSPIAKFSIGALAGCAAIAIPRLSSLFISGKESSVDYFPEAYIFGAIAFSVLIGLLVMVMEYKIPRPPKETLFAALAIPGVIAGSLNTAIETNDANITYQKAVELSKDVRSGIGIDVKTIETLEIIPIDMSSNSENTTNHISFNFISSAHASDEKRTLKRKSDSLGISVQRDVPKFAISIGNYEVLEDALKAAKIAKERNSSATLIKTKDGYEVLSSDKLLSETDATLEAIKIKNNLGITPKLLHVR